jgi:hypothetical protein
MNSPSSPDKDEVLCTALASQLGERIEHIHNQIDILKDRLQPIVRGVAEESPKEETNLPNPSSHCTKLWELNKEIKRVQNRLITLKDSIDL